MKPWQPDEAIARAAEVRPRKAWPAGATAGVLLVAAGCVSAALLLYKLGAPRDVFPS